MGNVPVFVKGQNNRMGYPVAMDLLDKSAPTTGSADSRIMWGWKHGKMASTWLEAAGYDRIGIPCAFVVNKEGLIAWVGDPEAIDDVLAAVADGSWDLKKARQDNIDFFVEIQARNTLMEGVGTMLGKHEFVKAAKSIGDFVAQKPDTRAGLLGNKFSFEINDMKDAAAAAETAELALTITKHSWASSLAEMAIGIVYPADGTPKLSNELAMRLAKRADQLDRGQRVYLKRAMAKLSFDEKDYVAAVRYGEDAMELAKAIAPAQLDDLRKELRIYREAAKK